VSIGILKPGCRVKHAVKHAQHDRWEGIVTEIETHERSDATWRGIWVRWIKPCGDPSEGATMHSPAELVPFEVGGGT
jgi:hypothetical protein